MAFDASRGEIVMYGGYDGYNTSYSSDTWTYLTTAPSALTAFGSSCSGSAGLPVLSALPFELAWSGDDLTLTADPLGSGVPAAALLGSSNTAAGTLGLPASLAGIGAPGCHLYVSPDVITTMSSGTGTARLTLAIPANPLFLGRSFYVQAIALDASANALGLLTTHGLSCLVGAR